VSSERSNLNDQQGVGWRGLVVEGLHHSGILRVLERMTRSWELDKRGGVWPRLVRASIPRIAIFCYHRIGVGGIPLYSELPPAEFEAQMSHLRKHYRIISLDQVVSEIADPVTSEPSVAVTFDDGYRGLFTEAFPILQAYQIPATIYLTIAPIETGQVAWYDRIFFAMSIASGDSLELALDGPRRFSLSSTPARMRAAVEIISWLRGCTPARRKEFCAILENKVPLPHVELQDRMLTWDQVHTMHLAGISFGAHTMTHPVVSRLSPSELEWEILESKRILEKKLDSPVHHFAFPFGKRDECGDAASYVLMRGGYKSAVTTESGLNSVSTDPLRMRRFSIDESASLAMFAAQLNRCFLNHDLAEISSSLPASDSKRPTKQAEVQPVNR